MVGTLRREARQGLALPWVVTYNGAFAGQLTVGAIVWGSARSAQVGYWVDGALAGRGITPTALAMAVDHCFFTTGLHRLEANIRPENHASRRVVEKLGFREEGVRRKQLHIDGAWRDHICYALDRGRRAAEACSCSGAEPASHRKRAHGESPVGANRFDDLATHRTECSSISDTPVLRCVT